MKGALWLTAVVAIGGGGVAFWHGADPAMGGGPAELSTFTVKRGDLDITIVENGTLVAKESRKVVPQFRSEGKIVYLLEEGRTVQEGEVVCRVDSMNLQNRVEEQEIEVVQAEAAYITAKTEQEVQVGENAAAIEKARIAIDTLAQKHEKYRDGEAPQERRVLEIAIKNAATEHHRANKRHEDSKKLVEQEFIKRSELEQHAIDLEKAVVQLEGAERALQLFEKYTRPMTLRQNETAVKDAERDLETATKRAKARANQKDADVLQAEKRIKQLKMQLEERRKDIDRMTMKAPCPGILIYGDPREPWYREQVKVGGMIYGGNTIMTIPDLRVMQVKIQVHEADINKVKLGQPTLVTMDTYPGLTLHGEVARIANIAASGNPWENTQVEVKRFDVEVEIKDTVELTLKPGISAKAQIQVETRKGVLFVPVQCVFLEAGSHWCLVAGNQAVPVRRQVTVGLDNGTYVEVLSGLEPGDKVMLYNPSLPTQREREADKTPEAAAVEASSPRAPTQVPGGSK